MTAPAAAAKACRAATKAHLMRSQAAWMRANDSLLLYEHPIHAWRAERILRHTRDVRGRVLDLGCYVGIVAEMIARQGGKEVVGIDRLDEALEQARARGISTVKADVDEAAIDFPDGHFDCVVAGHVLDEVYDPDAVAQEIFRVLKPGGRLIVTVPNLACLTNRLLMLLGLPPYNLEVRARRGVGHLRMFTFDTMRQLLADVGFIVRRMEASVFVVPSFRLPLIDRLLPGPEWRQPRALFSRSLARLMPRLGETIVALAEKPSSKGLAPQ